MVGGENEVVQIRDAAYSQAVGVPLDREPLRLGVEHEHGYNGLQRTTPADGLTRRHRTGRQHQVDFRIRQQRIHRAPRSGDRPVGNPPFLGWQDHREPRGDQIGDLVRNPPLHLVAAVRGAVDHDADDAGGAGHLRARRQAGERRQRGGREQAGRNPAPVPEATRAGGGAPAPAPFRCGAGENECPSPVHALFTCKHRAISSQFFRFNAL